MKRDFRNDVYQVVRSIPPGKVLTYGMVARLAGNPNYSRLVGKLMHDCLPTVPYPCHRVVNAQGRLAPVWAAQADLLKKEGVRLKANGCVDLKIYLWHPEEDE